MLIIIGIVGVQAQEKDYTVNGKPLTEYKDEYAQIIGEFGSVSFSVQVDFGHSHKVKERRVKDADGKEVQFRSMIEVLNLMDSIGYELDKVHSGTGKHMGTYFYILKRKQE